MKTGSWLWVVNLFGLSFFFFHRAFRVDTAAALEKPKATGPRRNRPAATPGGSNVARSGHVYDAIGATGLFVGTRRAGRPPAAWNNFDALINVRTGVCQSLGVWTLVESLAHLPFSPHCSLRPQSLSAPVSSHVSPSLLPVTPFPLFPLFAGRCRRRSTRT